MTNGSTRPVATATSGIGLEYLAERVRPLRCGDRVIIKERKHRMCACTQSVIAGEIETRYRLSEIAHVWKALSHHSGGRRHPPAHCRSPGFQRERETERVATPERGRVVPAGLEYKQQRSGQALSLFPARPHSGGSSAVAYPANAARDEARRVRQSRGEQSRQHQGGLNRPYSEPTAENVSGAHECQWYAPSDQPSRVPVQPSHARCSGRRLALDCAVAPAIVTTQEIARPPGGSGGRRWHWVGRRSRSHGAAPRIARRAPRGHTLWDVAL